MAHNVLPTHTPSRRRTLPLALTALSSTGALFLGAGAGALGAALLATPAGAAEFTVTSTDDAGVGSLRQAIIDANANPGLDTITFAGGVSGTVALTTDLPAITEGLTITGPGALQLSVSGGDQVHAFSIDTNGSGGVVISGLTVTHSIALLLANGDISGGGISVVDTPLTLNDVVLDQNTAVSSTLDAAGGGLFVENTPGSGDVSITDSVISRNLVSDPVEYGFAIGGGAFIAADNVTISNTRIHQNEGDLGGGVHIEAIDDLAISSSTITGNTARYYGGGMSVGATRVSVTDTVVNDNDAQFVGGAYITTSSQGSDTSTLTISDTSISNNTATELGGASIFNLDESQTATLDRVTITGNSGGMLGGLSVSGTSLISSSTIANNIGAGINLGFDFGPVAVQSDQFLPAIPGPQTVSATLTNTTVTGNSREGIMGNAQLSTGSVPSSAIASPSSASTPSSPGAPPEISLGLIHVLAADNGLEDVAIAAVSLFSLIERPNAHVLAGYGTLTGFDPQLQPLLTVSETVSVVPILLGSPAWDAGYPGFVPPPATDQRGLPRVVQIVDIGAYEVQEVSVVPAFTG